MADILIAATIDDGVLYVDNPGEQDGILQALAMFWHLGKPEKQPIRFLFVSFGDRPAHARQAVLDGASHDGGMVFEIDLRWVPGRSIEAVDALVGSRKLAIALLAIARVVPGELTDHLLPHVQALRHVPHGLDVRQIPRRPPSSRIRAIAPRQPRIV